MRPYHRQDYLLAITTFLLVVFGLIMVSSASVVQSYEVTGTNNFYFLRQGGYAIVGLLAWWFFSKLDYRFWKRYATIALGAGIVMLILVLIPGIGVEAGGAHRWIGIGSFTLQASEFAKFGLIIYLAYWFDQKGSRVGDFYGTFLPFIGLLLLIFFLVIQEPDMGTSMVLSGIAVSMFFVAGAKWSQIGLMISLGAAGVLALILAAPYRLQRLLTFLNPGADPLGTGYHFNQSLLAIGSGGLFGLGYGHSRQKFLYLPEAASDSIFAVIGEELGLIGGAFFVLLPFAIIIWRGLIIARSAPDTFGRLLAFGITMWIGLQAVLNVGAIVGLIPLTGIPLPFISMGGTALVFNLVAAGVLLNISKQTLNTGNDENPLSWWGQWWSHYSNTSRRRISKVEK